MLKRIFFFFLKQVIVLVVTVVVTLITVRIIQERTGPELKPWHTVAFTNEFTAQRTDVPDFKTYLSLEDKLFAELKDKVESRLAPEDRTLLNRYNPGSVSNPDRQPRNWNRSYVHIPKDPTGAVVLIHGLTDSPYSMHATAELFEKKGYAVFVPRMPGHGTTPGGLSRAKWPDWVAATRLACHAARQAAQNKPLVVVGYSNGGLLAVKYTLDEIDRGDQGLPPQKVILFAPAIGITRFAALSGWYKALAVIPYFKKIAWLSIDPEYDPFKFNSFPKMASDQIYRLTQVVNRQLEALTQTDGFDRYPPVLAFTSVVDSTVLTPSLVTTFYARLKSNGSELVLYDINRFDALGEFIKDKQEPFLTSLSSAPSLPFTLTLITNEAPDTLKVKAHRRAANSPEWEDESLGLEWPRGVYSLSHLAIPNSPRDPLYGNRPDLREQGKLVLGLLQPRGENGVLDLPASQFLRLRFNPFYNDIERRISDFISDKK